MLAKGYKVSITQDEQTGDLMYSKVTTGNNNGIAQSGDLKYCHQKGK